MENVKNTWHYDVTHFTSKNGRYSLGNEEEKICIEWQKTDILSPDLASFKKDLSELAAEKLACSELCFLKSNPEAVHTELFLKACKPLFDHGIENVDWTAVQQAIYQAIKQFYLADLSLFSKEVIQPLLNDIFFCVTAKKKGESQAIGFLLFSVTPALPEGNIKIINFFMHEHATLFSHQLLMGTIYHILPEAKRLFLFARPTDLIALNMYQQMGFKLNTEPFQDINHPINNQVLQCLEYLSEHSNFLQNMVCN